MLHAAAVALLTLLTSASAAQPIRSSASAQSYAQAGRLCAQAKNLRELRLPLREQRATRHVAWAYDKLQKLGVKINRKHPVVFDSTAEQRLLRQARDLLRSAPQGSETYALRQQTINRAHQLHHALYDLPRGMRAFSAIKGKQGKPELVINLDNSFYNKADQLLPIMAHEQHHLRDIERALRLKAVLSQPELKQAQPGTPEHQRRQRLQAKVDALLSSSQAETRAFRTQARALGLAQWPLGTWWRAPQGEAIDAAYPPAALNRALIKGYLQGVARSLSAQLRDAAPEQRALVRRYLAGHKDVLRSQADAYYSAVRKDQQRDPAALNRYQTRRAQTLQQAEDLLARGGALGADSMYLLGQADAFVGAAPQPRARKILEPAQ